MADQEKARLRQEAIESVKAIFERWHLIAASKGYKGFDLSVMRDAEVMDASLGPPDPSAVDSALFASPGVLSSSVVRLYLTEEYGNLNGVMHGGAAGVIFDMFTTVALGPLSKPGFWDFMGGVTRTLNISYLKAVPIDTTIHVHAYVYQAGRTMALIKGWMTSEDGQTVYATCDHHKVHTPTKKDHLEYKIEWDKKWDKKDPESKL